MKRFFNLLALLLFVQISYCQRTLTPIEQQEDFAQLKKSLVQHNTGVYLYISEEDFEQHYNNYKQELNTPKTELEFSKLLKRFITPIQERHLSIKGYHKKKSNTGAIFEKGQVKIFPFYIKYRNDSTAFIIRNASADSTFQTPTKLLSINGETMAEIRAKMEQYVIHDYGIKSRINYEISNAFSTKYYQQIDTTSNFHIVCENYDKTIQEFDFKGVPNKEFNKKIEENSKAILEIEEFKPRFRTEYYDSLSTGYLKVGTFSSDKKRRKSTYKGETYTLKKTAKAFFETVDANSYSNVIIDLRNNTGGSVHYMLNLLTYVQGVDKKTTIYKQTRKPKLSKKLKTIQGKTYKPKKNHFNGHVYILTNPGSYSASVMFASNLKTIRPNVTIVGEQAGGRYDGTTAGQFKIITLKNSGIIARIPKHIYEYIAKEQLSNLHPDITAKPVLTDYFSYDSDEVLRVTLEAIKNESNSH